MPLRPPAGFISAFFDPLRNPNAPTIGTATGGDTTASVAFTAPANPGGSAITAYYAVSNPGQFTGTSATSPVSVTGLTNGTAYTFNVWALNSYGPGVFSAASNSVTPAFIAYAVFGGGANTGGSASSVIDYVNIATTGNATFWGNLTVTGNNGPVSASSTTRGVYAGISSSTSVMTYITFSTTGNSVTFGNMLGNYRQMGGTSNATRGLFAGGPFANLIQYITIATTGDTTSFGDLNIADWGNPAGCASPTRALFGGGNMNDAPYGYYNRINYVTIATTGNASTFGNLTQTRTAATGVSSSTRGIFAGGGLSDGTTMTNVIDYVTIASTGNATDFGDLTVARSSPAGASNNSRGVFGGGGPATNTSSNTIDYITIASAGNATAFGGLTTNRRYGGACGNAGGGLQ